MILITGGMGFIGMHVSRELAGHDSIMMTYRQTRRDDRQVEEFIGSPVRIERLDVANPYSVADVFARQRPDTVVHLTVPGLGVMSPAEEMSANVSGLANVLEAAHLAGVGRVCVASSVAVYWGIDNGPFHEEHSLPVTSANATSAMKKAMEILALHFADRTSLEVILLRIGMIYGPLYHSLANLPARLLHYAVRGRPFDFSLHGWERERLRVGLDLCYVSDCANAIAKVATAQTTKHSIYNIGGGAAVSAGEALEALEAVVPGGTPEDDAIKSFPDVVNRQHYMDISRMAEEFGFRPGYSLRQGFREYANWLREHDL